MTATPGTGAGNVISGNYVDGVDDYNGSNVIAGNLIGLSADGSAALANSGDGVDAASGDTIGGTAAGAGNVISGNAASGVGVGTDNLVAGNFIGTDIAGMVAIANLEFGVELDSGASGNTIGGLTATPGTGAGNVISGNVNRGIEDSGGSNIIAGNLIGLSADGTAALANGGDGVYALSGDTIGGTAAGAGNVISGNEGAGVAFEGDDDLLAGNFIGTDITGMVAIANEILGVEIDFGGSGNTIGGLTATPGTGAGNVISGNNGPGIVDTGSNLIVGNLIGLNATGTAALANAGDGITVLGGDTIGGTAAGAGNVISGNAGNGINLSGAGATGNVVAENLIGTDITGTTAFDGSGNPLGNANGVEIDAGATDNTIGGTTAGSGNVISGNGNGVEITGSGTSGNVVADNLIGTDITGTTSFDANGNSLGDSNDGVEIDAGATDNTIGGTTAGSGNVISGNFVGVEITGSGTNGNVVAGDKIGTDVTGTTAFDSNGEPLGNVIYGVFINLGASDNIVGGSTAAARNIISGNVQNGVELYGSGTSGNVVDGDFIGTDVTGTTAIDGNGKPLGNINGVDIDFGASDNTIGGTTSGSGNVISGNLDYGVFLSAREQAATCLREISSEPTGPARWQSPTSRTASTSIPAPQATPSAD